MADRRPRPFAYVPIAGTATAFAYNLSIGGERVTNLRLSPATIAGIFTGSITQWDDAAIARDNPYLALPGRAIVSVVRSDGAGSSYQLTRWLASEAAQAWDAYCTRAGITFTGSCGPTSFFPRGATSISQAGSLGVAGYLADNNDTITYVDYGAVLQSQLPAVKLRNAAGSFVEPTAPAVSIALRNVEVNNDASDPATYLAQEAEGAYRSADPRAYPLSAYTYAVIPTSATDQFSADKGRTLGAFLSSVGPGHDARHRDVHARGVDAGRVHVDRPGRGTWCGHRYPRRSTGRHRPGRRTAGGDGSHPGVRRHGCDPGRAPHRAPTAGSRLSIAGTD